MNKNLILPLIFLSECVKMNPELQQQFETMEDNIKKLLENEDLRFHRELS